MSLQPGTNDVRCDYYIDNTFKVSHTGSNFKDKPLNLIIDLQMEKDSGSPGPTNPTYYYAKNVTIQRGH